MSVLPVVRYMLPCEDCQVEPGNQRRVTIHGLISTLVALDDPPYPVLYRELCLFIAFADGRGRASAKVVCAFEETGETVFESPPQKIELGNDPLTVTMILFRLRDCPFPFPGIYQLQLWYDGVMLEERPLRLR
jgi:hypothetical protein